MVKSIVEMNEKELHTWIKHYQDIVDHFADHPIKGMRNLSKPVLKALMNRLEDVTT